MLTFFFVFCLGNLTKVNAERERERNGKINKQAMMHDSVEVMCVNIECIYEPAHTSIHKMKQTNHFRMM